MLLASTHISNAANTQFLLLPLLDEPRGCLLSLNHVLYCDGHDPAPVEMWRIQLLCFNNPSWVVSDLVHRQCGWSGAPCNFHALFNLSVSLAPTWLVYNQVRLTILPSHVLKSSLADGGVATLSPFLDLWVLTLQVAICARQITAPSLPTPASLAAAAQHELDSSDRWPCLPGTFFPWQGVLT